MESRGHADQPSTHSGHLHIYAFLSSKVIHQPQPPRTNLRRQRDSLSIYCFLPSPPLHIASHRLVKQAVSDQGRVLLSRFCLRRCLWSPYCPGLRLGHAGKLGIIKSTYLLLSISSFSSQINLLSTPPVTLPRFLFLS